MSIKKSFLSIAAKTLWKKTIVSYDILTTNDFKRPTPEFNLTDMIMICQSHSFSIETDLLGCKSEEIEQISFEMNVNIRQIPEILTSSVSFEFDINNDFENRSEDIDFRVRATQDIRCTPLMFGSVENLSETGIIAPVTNRNVRFVQLISNLTKVKIKKFEPTIIEGRVFNSEVYLSSEEQNYDVWPIVYPNLLPPTFFDTNITRKKKESKSTDFYKPLYRFQTYGIYKLIEDKNLLLADEMGTGKTVQAIVALKLLIRHNHVKRALVLCPKSVIGSKSLSMITGEPEGWVGHFLKWAPELSVNSIKGAEWQRRTAWNFRYHVVVTSYDTFKYDHTNGYDLDHFDCVIIDEAQKIKNPASARSQAVLSLKTERRWALTGTPLENKTDDLITIFRFVEPKLKLNPEMDSDQIRRNIRNHMLRRLKKDVLKDLPPKVRQEHWLELDDTQRKEYESVLNRGKKSILRRIKKGEKEFDVSRCVLQTIQSLKQICNFASGCDESPKTELLLEQVETIEENNAKVLIFTQYVDKGINKLTKLLEKNGHHHVVFYGKTTTENRDDAVRRFRSDEEIRIFLATPSTAGTGLSLTEASYVIHFDHWWNPAVMWQAEDRAHRPGQTQPVNIYSYWIRDSIEEKIKMKLVKKEKLIKEIVDANAMKDIEKAFTLRDKLDILNVDTKDKDVEKYLDKIEKKPTVKR